MFVLLWESHYLAFYTIADAFHQRKEAVTNTDTVAAEVVNTDWSQYIAVEEGSFVT